MDKSGTQERKGEGEYLGKGIGIKLFGDKSDRDKGCVDRRSRSSGDQELGVWVQGVVDKESPTRGFIDKEFGVQGGADKEFIGKDFVDKKSSSRRRSA